VTYAEDVAEALRLSLILDSLRRASAIEALRHHHEVLKRLKEMPKLVPEERAIRLSEIVPELGEGKGKTLREVVRRVRELI